MTLTRRPSGRLAWVFSARVTGEVSLNIRCQIIAGLARNRLRQPQPVQPIPQIADFCGIGDSYGWSLRSCPQAGSDYCRCGRLFRYGKSRNPRRRCWNREQRFVVSPTESRRDSWQSEIYRNLSGRLHRLAVEPIRLVVPLADCIHGSPSKDRIATHRP